MATKTGKTKDSGWQFGLRKSFPIDHKRAWDLMFSDHGLKLWLGELKKPLAFQKEFHTKDGINGFLRVLKPYSHIRLNWQKQSWPNMSTLQVRIIAKDRNHSTISFHQEKLTDEKQRAEMKEYWQRVMGKITIELSQINY